MISDRMGILERYHYQDDWQRGIIYKCISHTYHAAQQLEGYQIAEYNL